MKYIYKGLGITIKTISPYDHISLKIEIHARIISCMIAKQLNCTGQMWTLYLHVHMHITDLQAQH